MKAITIKQPWVDLILREGKDIENRTWYTKYRGPILIHSSKKGFRMSNPNSVLTLDQYNSVRDIPNLICNPGAEGSICGMATIVDCIKDSKSVWAESGCYHWVLENPVELMTPVYWKGGLSLWNVDERELCESLRGADWSTVYNYFKL